jgi:hypothetical protein
MNSFLTVASSLEYDNVKIEVTPLVENLTSGGLTELLPDEFKSEGSVNFNLTDRMREALEFMQTHCQIETSYVFSTEGFTFVIPCELSNSTPEELVQEGIETIIEQSYYAEYNCSFWDCILESKNPLSLISKNAQGYWEGRFYFSFISVLILIGLLLLFMENRINFPIVLGSLIIVSALPIIKIKSFLGIFIPDYLLFFFGIFFSKATTIFWIMIIIGVLILGGGIALKIWKPSFIEKISKKK